MTSAVIADLLVVVPVYNEAANVANLVAEWLPALKALPVSSQMLLINDGSKDETLSILKALGDQHPNHLIVIDKLNAGHGATCRLGYEIASASNCKWVLQIDSDGQCDAGYLNQFWDETSDHDVVMGLRKRRDDGMLRMLTSKACRFISSLVVGCNLKDPNVPYRLMRREVLEAAIRRIPANFNIHNVALTYVLYKSNNHRIARIPIHFRARAGGENSIDVSKVMSWGAAMLFELHVLRRSLRNG